MFRLTSLLVHLVPSPTGYQHDRIARAGPVPPHVRVASNDDRLRAGPSPSGGPADAAPRPPAALAGPGRGPAAAPAAYLLRISKYH